MAAAFLPSIWRYKALSDESNLPDCQGQRRMFLWKIQAGLQFGDLVMAVWVWIFNWLLTLKMIRSDSAAVHILGSLLALYGASLIAGLCRPHSVHPTTGSSSQHKPLVFCTLSKVMVHALCALTSVISQIQVVAVKVLLSGISPAYGTYWVIPTVIEKTMNLKTAIHSCHLCHLLYLINFFWQPQE